MHTWIKRSLGVAAVAGGLVLAGAATAHADDGSQPSHHPTSLSAPVEIDRVSLGLGRESHEQSRGRTGCGCSGGDSATTERSGLEVEVGRTTLDPVATLGGSDRTHDRGARVEAPADVEKVTAGLGSTEERTSTGSRSGSTTTRDAASGLGVEVDDVDADPAVRLGGDRGLEVEVPVDVEKVAAGLGSRETSTTTGGHTAPGTTTEHTESGLGLDVGQLTTHPAVDLDGVLTVELPVSLGGLDLGLGHTETSTSTGPDAPVPGDGGTPTTPVDPTTPTQPTTPTAPTAPGTGGPTTGDDGTTGGQPSTGDTGTLPVPGTQGPGTVPGGTLPGTGVDGGSGLPDLVGGLLGTVVGTVTGGLEDAVEGLLGGGQPTAPTVPAVPGTDPGTRPEPAQPAPAPEPTDPGSEGPDAGGTPPTESPDCGCAGGDAGATDDVTGTVGDVVDSTTEVVDEVVETVTETVSDTVDTVTDVVDGATDGLTGGTTAPAEDDDC